MLFTCPQCSISMKTFSEAFPLKVFRFFQTASFTRKISNIKTSQVSQFRYQSIKKGKIYFIYRFLLVIVYYFRYI